MAVHGYIIYVCTSLNQNTIFVNHFRKHRFNICLIFTWGNKDFRSDGCCVAMVVEKDRLVAGAMVCAMGVIETVVGKAAATRVLPNTVVVEIFIFPLSL